MERKRTAEEWVRIVEEYKASGLGLTAWCRERGINAKTMGNHVNATKGAARVKKERPRKSSEWKALIDKQRGSGLEMDEWCKSEGINAHTMKIAEYRIERKSGVGLANSWVSVDMDNGGSQSEPDVSAATGDGSGEKSSVVNIPIENETGIEEYSVEELTKESVKRGEPLAADLAANANGKQSEPRACTVALENDGASAGVGCDTFQSGGFPNGLNGIRVCEMRGRLLGMIKVRFGVIEIEADAEYPWGNVANIVERLVSPINDTRDRGRVEVKK